MIWLMALMLMVQPPAADAPRRVTAVDDGEALATRAALETIEEGEIVWLDLAFAPGEACEEGPRWEGEAGDGVTGLPAGGDYHLIAELRAARPKRSRSTLSPASIPARPMRHGGCACGGCMPRTSSQFPPHACFASTRCASIRWRKAPWRGGARREAGRLAGRR